MHISTGRIPLWHVSTSVACKLRLLWPVPARRVAVPVLSVLPVLPVRHTA